MNNIQILEPNNIFNKLDNYGSSNLNKQLNEVPSNLSYSFMSKDSSSSYKKQQIQQGSDSFTMSEFTSSYTKRTMTKNISTSTSAPTSPFSIDDLTNMNQLYSSQKQLALPYTRSNSGLANQEVVYDFMRLKNEHNLDSYIKPLEQASYSLRSKAPYELFSYCK